MLTGITTRCLQGCNQKGRARAYPPDLLPAEALASLIPIPVPQRRSPSYFTATCLSSDLRYCLMRRASSHWPTLTAMHAAVNTCRLCLMIA